MKTYLQIILLFINLSSFAQSSKISVQGQVVSLLNGEPLAGVNIVIKGTSNGTITDGNGAFMLEVQPSEILIFSYIGYETREVRLEGQTELYIELSQGLEMLQNIEVFSTGYQQVPKERATGSFEQVNNELLNRSVGTDVISRLQAVVPGLIFNRAGTNSSNDISIRGISTINANAQPLIILNNFPYEGDLNNINPNDVESITILKDAAAASIWGAKAGNGVIVITTKQGKFQEPIKISFNSNVTLGERPDLYYVPTMNSTDYIDIEKRLFDEGYYQSTENSPYYAPLTPAVELFIARRDGLLSEAEVEAQLAALKSQDIRRDFDKYLYRTAINQQYSLSISGGSKNQRYFLSAGYDHNMAALVDNEYNRFTINASHHYKLLDNLELFTGVNLIRSSSTNNNRGTVGLGIKNATLYPYARLTNENGAISTIKGYRPAFLQQAEEEGLLNWEYKPLEEIALADNTTKASNYRLNTGINYTALPGLSISLNYQFSNGSCTARDHKSIETYYTRNLINTLTQVNSDGSLTHPVPLGGILDMDEAATVQHTVRGQITFEKSFTDKHHINAIAGMERNNSIKSMRTYRLYGYDDEHATNAIVDYGAYYPSYVYPASVNNSIPYMDEQGELTDRFLSYYANAAYTYSGRYTLTGSARLDRSNLFGVKTNQKGVPLWSAGVAWNIFNESFYSWEKLPYLKLRATYGSSGNINKSLSAYTTARYYNGVSSQIKQPYASIVNPPNPELRWERVKMMNVGIDFETADGLVSGSLEYYNKRSIDLIGSSPIAPSTGITSFTGNTADMKGQGIDVTVKTKNFDRQFKWFSHWLFSYNTNEVTNHEVENYARSYLDFIHYPREGYPLYGIYSYPWAGLDPNNGDPLGYVEGKPSNDYISIYLNANADSLVFSGPARPVVFGTWRNTFIWKNISLSVNISYHLGYYFRRRSINYGNTYGLGGGFGDYYKRWQKPGDERFTQVPSVPASGNFFRDDFYSHAAVLVEKGDHIRLRDVRLAYELRKAELPFLPFEKLQLYLYANNLGLLWKANKMNLDPDYISGPPPRSLSLGIKVDF